MDVLDEARHALDAPGQAPDPRCRKCGSDMIHTAWHRWETECLYSSRITGAGEHLHRTCQRCGFYWAEPPLDAEP